MRIPQVEGTVTPIQRKSWKKQRAGSGALPSPEQTDECELSERKLRRPRTPVSASLRVCQLSLLTERQLRMKYRVSRKDDAKSHTEQRCVKFRNIDDHPDARGSDLLSQHVPHHGYPAAQSKWSSYERRQEAELRRLSTLRSFFLPSSVQMLQIGGFRCVFPFSQLRFESGSDLGSLIFWSS
jgi:hypothetical protein